MRILELLVTIPEQYSWVDVKSTQGILRITNAGQGYSFYPKDDEGKRLGDTVLFKENQALIKLPDDYTEIGRDKGGIRKKYKELDNGSE